MTTESPRPRRKRHPYPEVRVDFNSRWTERGYCCQSGGAVGDLARLGLTLEQAIGKRFTFNGGDDGEDGDILGNGIVVHDPTWGYMALIDEDGLYWRSEIDPD